jgi:hypothetical protein
MQILGRRISKWWLLLLLPLAVISSPLLLILFFAGNNLAGAILGPPAIWSRPIHTPLHLDLVGQYRESTRHVDQKASASKAILDLNADDSMSVTAIPYESFGNRTCVLSGRGRWGGPDHDNKINLIYESDRTQGACESGSYPYLEVVGHAKPYGLYWVIGDPDSGTGVWLKTKN